MELSIIIPVYNSENYIERCIDSVEKSTIDCIEIVAINDGSTDNSLKILENLANKYKNIKVISQENHGVAKARNRGIVEAEGDYIAFVDNDDYVDSDYFERLLKMAQSNNYDIVIEGYERPNRNGKIVEKTKLRSGAWSRYQLTAPWGRIFKTRFIRDNEIKFLDSCVGEDAYFNISAISRTDNIGISHGCGYKWYYNEESISNTTQRRPMEDVYVLLDKIKEVLSANNKDIGTNEEYFLIKFCCWYIYYINGNKCNSRELIMTELDKIFRWLDVNIPNYRKNRNISLIFPVGEKLVNKAAVFLLIISRSMYTDMKLLNILSGRN